MSQYTRSPLYRSPTPGARVPAYPALGYQVGPSRPLTFFLDVRYVSTIRHCIAIEKLMCLRYGWWKHTGAHRIAQRQIEKTPS